MVVPRSYMDESALMIGSSFDDFSVEIAYRLESALANKQTDLIALVLS